MINHSINRICIHPIENATFARTLVPINFDSFWFNDWLFWRVLFFCSRCCFLEWRKKPPKQRGMRISSAYCAHDVVSLPLLLMSSPSTFCVFAPCIVAATTATSIHSFFSCCESRNSWLVLLFFALTLIISSYSWIIFFPSRLLFTHFLANHREILSYFEWNKKWVDFFYLRRFFFGIFHVPHALH